MASAGQLVSLLGAPGSPGIAQLGLNFSGSYDVFLGYYDQNAGDGQLGVKLDGKTLDYWVLNKELGSGISNDTFIRRQVATNQALSVGQTFEIRAFEGKRPETVRFDYIEFVSTGTTPPVPPVPVPTIRLEAESLNLSAYRTQTLSSGQRIISLANGETNERGKATTNLNLDGFYDIYIGYFDEADGQAQMSVKLGGETLKYWVLNQNLSDSQPNTGNFVRRQLAEARQISAGTALEIMGLEKDGDSAAVDYIEFVPVDLSTRPGRLAFDQNSYIANENGTAQITVKRIAGTKGSVSALVQLTGETAIANLDFNATPLSVTFAPGETTKTLTIPLINDTLTESTERFKLALLNPTGGATLDSSLATATFSIVDDETSLVPRLFIDSAKIAEIKGAIARPGSHHQQAFAAMKVRVDQNDWRIYDESPSDTNTNYARTWLAREAAMAYQLTNDPRYAQTAFAALEQVYSQGKVGDANLESDKGLTKAMVGLGFAIAYDWAAAGWTPEQRSWVKGKIIEGLNSWPSFSHPNVPQTGGTYHSNWTAVTRGAELVMMLAVGEENTRSARYTKIKSDLELHIRNGYGQYGFNQEGNGYLTYGGSILATAVNALRSVGDTSLDTAFRTKEFWKLPLYGSAFNAEQESIQYGVGNVRFNAEGWSSFLFADVPADQLGYYQSAYDSARGVNNPAAAADKFEDKRAATPWSLIYYPTNSTAIDPDQGNFAPLLASQDQGGYVFRNRWQDANDTLVTLVGDYTSKTNAWNQPEVFNLGLFAHGDRFIAGPKDRTDAAAYSTLLVDGKVPNVKDTGKQIFQQAYEDGGYVVVDGGTAYQNLGLDSAQRHLLVDFEADSSTLFSTLDRVRDQSSHSYTWQINVGEALDNGGISVTTGREGGLQTFLLTSADGDYVKGWVLEPSNATLSAGDPLRITTTGVNSDLWVAMLSGSGTAPVGSVSGSGLNATLTVDDLRVRYDAATNRIVSQSLATGSLAPAARFLTVEPDDLLIPGTFVPQASFGI